VIFLQVKNRKKHGTIVKIHNDLARAHWSTDSIWELRIVSVIASLVQDNDEDFCTYRVPIAMMGLKSLGRNYEDIKRSILSLVKKVVVIKGERRNFVAYTIFDKCGYEDGYLIAGFHPDLKPFFQGLKKRFTLYKPDEIIRLPSMYSQKLYMLLKSWSSCTEATIKLEELHDMLGVPDSLRNKYPDFRRKVLERAHYDISENTSLKFDWIPIKEGRAVNSIKFVFRALSLPTRTSELEEHEKLQKESNTCFELFLRKKRDCHPRMKSEKCKFCLERGRMSAKKAVLAKRETLELKESHKNI
jgi:plasmid replication initiation protein